VLVSTNGGLNLLQGNNENTAAILGGGVAAADIDLTTYFAEANRRFLGDEPAMSEYFSQQAREWIRTHKWEAAKLYLRKCLYYFSYRNDLSIKAEGSRAKDAVMLVSYGTLLGLLLLRLVLIGRYRPSRLEWMLLTLYVANVFASAVFYPRIRFRLPFDFLLIGVAALFLDRALVAWRPGDDGAFGEPREASRS
jgi:hypothetical protein